MARIKVRFELNKGRTGAPMSKLGDIAKQAERFLRALASELVVETRSEEWLAVNFRNGSVSFDAECQIDISAAKVDAINRGLEFLADFDANSEGPNGSVSHATVLEFAKLGTLIDADEVIGMGIYSRERSKPKMRWIPYAKTAAILGALEAPIPAYGSIQGIIHSFQKEASRPYFRVRELSTDLLISCFYPSRLYPDIIRALEERTTVLHVAGAMKLDRASRTISELQVDRIEPARIMTAAEFEEFFGSCPEYTGDLSTDEWIDAIRADAG